MRVLDLGCGDGAGSELLAQTATNVLGVDARAPVAAAAATGRRKRVSFEAADPWSFLDGPAGKRFDAIVCLTESLAPRELDRLAPALGDHARAGARLLLAIANRDGPRGGDERIAARHGRASAALADLPCSTVVSQHLVEGAVFSLPGLPVELTVGAGALTSDHASSTLLCVGFPREAVVRAAGVAATMPVHTPYALRLAAANRQLLRDNRSLVQALQDAAARADRAVGERDLWRRRCLTGGYRPGADVDGPATAEHVDRPRQSANLELREVASGMIVHRLADGGLHHLNNTASVVFQLCDGAHTAPEIAAGLADAFGMAEAPTDVVAQCIADLRARRVVD